MAVSNVEKRTVVDLVDAKVRGMLNRQEMHLPADYSPENALKSAWLKLQEVRDKGGKPVLHSCTQASIANSLFDMVIQGLNPAKEQCYFIAYGDQLSCQASYFGSMAIAKRVDPTIAEIVPGVVYEGDVFRYNITRGKVEIVEHQQELGNIDKDKIIAAYCEIVDHDGNIKKTEIMTFDEIKQSWRQSQANPFKEGSTHSKFAAEMCKRTVTNRALKPIVNASSDRHLVQSFNRASDVAAENDFEQEIAEHANGEVIDIEGEILEETDDKADENTEKQAKTEEKTPEKEQNPPKNEQKEAENTQKSQKDSAGQQTLNGPGF